MPLYDYRCNAGHRYEALRKPGTQAEQCECGQLAIRVYGYRAAIKLDPEPDLRGKFRRFSEATLEMAHLADRRQAETGEPTPTPDFYGAAKARVKQMQAAGEAPPPRRAF